MTGKVNARNLFLFGELYAERVLAHFGILERVEFGALLAHIEERKLPFEACGFVFVHAVYNALVNCDILTARFAEAVERARVNKAFEHALVEIFGALYELHEIGEFAALFALANEFFYYAHAHVFNRGESRAHRAVFHAELGYGFVYGGRKHRNSAVFQVAEIVANFVYARYAVVEHRGYEFHGIVAL